MKNILLSIAIAANLFGTQVVALSCLRPDPANSFAQFRDSADAYYIMHGTLTFDQSLMPQGVQNNPRDPDPLPANFVGNGLTADGFTVPLDRQITLQPICAGPWCGTLESGTDYLIFARALDDGISLDIDPCGVHAFPNPSQETRDKMAVCLNGGPCAPAN